MGSIIGFVSTSCIGAGDSETISEISCLVVSTIDCSSCLSSSSVFTVGTRDVEDFKILKSTGVGGGCVKSKFLSEIRLSITVLEYSHSL